MVQIDESQGSLSPRGQPGAPVASGSKRWFALACPSPPGARAYGQKEIDSMEQEVGGAGDPFADAVARHAWLYTNLSTHHRGPVADLEDEVRAEGVHAHTDRYPEFTTLAHEFTGACPACTDNLRQLMEITLSPADRPVHTVYTRPAQPRGLCQ